MSEAKTVAELAKECTIAYEAIWPLKEQMNEIVTRAFNEIKRFQKANGFYSGSSYNWINDFSATDFELSSIIENGIWFSDGYDHLITFEELEDITPYLEAEYASYVANRSANNLMLKDIRRTSLLAELAALEAEEV